jgi:hypothetical protein
MTFREKLIEVMAWGGEGISFVARGGVEACIDADQGSTLKKKSNDIYNQSILMNSKLS